MTTTVQALSGEWMIHTATEQKKMLVDYVQAQVYCFDVSAVSDLDSAGLQLWLAAQKSLAQGGLELQLVSPNKTVKEVLQCYGLSAMLAPLDPAMDGVCA